MKLSLIAKLVEHLRFEHDCQGATACGICEDIREYEGPLCGNSDTHAGHYYPGALTGEWCNGTTLAQQAQPEMPTREMIAKALDGVTPGLPWSVAYLMADAVLALFAPKAEPPVPKEELCDGSCSWGAPHRKPCPGTQ